MSVTQCKRMKLLAMKVKLNTASVLFKPLTAAPQNAKGNSHQIPSILRIKL